MKKSLIQQGKYCYVCGTEYALHRHHVFEGTANRRLSEEDGAYCYLCYLHHNGSNRGVHFNKELDLLLKRRTQEAWEKTKGNRQEFINRYGKSWLY
jgi:hypothetical protein|nr:MAG TPA: Recombination enhancement function protein nuclease, DNase, HYDROLASE.4A [Caudoviricetes sp.]